MHDTAWCTRGVLLAGGVSLARLEMPAARGAAYLICLVLCIQRSWRTRNLCLWVEDRGDEEVGSSSGAGGMVVVIGDAIVSSVSRAIGTIGSIGSLEGEWKLMV